MNIFIALGANQTAQYEGAVLRPSDTFAKAVQWLGARSIRCDKASSLWESPAWPDPDAQNAYTNAVISVTTNRTPLALLQVLKTCEHAFGRKQSRRNAARPLDIDILDYKGQVIDTPKLTLPHPRMLSRPFVLFPLQEVTGDWRDPINGCLLDHWIARLPYHDVAPLRRLITGQRSWQGCNLVL